MNKVVNINFIIAQLFGIFALVVLMLSFQKNNKKQLLKYQMISSLLFAIQYMFLNAYTGSLMNLACMLRNFIFNKYKEKVPTYWLIITIIFVVMFSMITYNEVISLLPMIAVILYSVATWSGNLKIIRITEIISYSLHIIYNIKVMAITGLIATILELCAAIVAIYRYDLKKYN